MQTFQKTKYPGTVLYKNVIFVKSTSTFKFTCRERVVALNGTQVQFMLSVYLL